MKNLSLNAKITGILSLFSLGSLLIAALGLHGLNSLDDSIDLITEVNVPRLESAYILRSNYRDAALRQQQFVTTESKDDWADIEKQMREDDALLRKTFDEAIAQASEQGRALLTDSKEKYEGWWDKSVLSRRAQAAGDNQKALSVIAEMKPLRLHADKNFQTLVKQSTDVTEEESRQVDSLYATLKAMLLVLSLACILACSIMAFFVLRAASRVIQAVIADLNEGAVQVSAAAQQIASSSEEISQAATEQAASLEQTASSIEEMNSMVAKNSENAASASHTSTRSQEAVGQGQGVVRKMAESMEAINRSSEGMAATVAVIEQIDKETKVINEIVNKTELLSFNASVEAARAGEHGKGFAVVAEEVGNLARMSGAAAEKIASLLEESKRKVQQMVQETKTNVSTGTQITHECGNVFGTIVENVSQVSGMASEIATASQEQARGCAEITKAMNQLDQMTQQNTAVSEECASAAEELSAQAESLRNAVTQLVHAVNGGAETSVAHAAPAAQISRRPVAPSGKVVPFRGQKTVAPRFQAAAAGDTPSYDSNGFSDV